MNKGFSLSFQLARYGSKIDGTYAINLRVIIYKEVKYLQTGVRVQPQWFDLDSQSVNIPKDKKLSSDYNMILNQCKSRANDIFVYFRLKNQEIDMDIFMKHYDNPAMRYDFISFMQEAIDHEARLVEKATAQQYGQTIYWMKMFRGDKWPFLEINEKSVRDFEAFMKKHHLAANTRWKHHKNIKKFLKIAERDGISIDNPYLNFKVSKKESGRRPLTKDQLLSLIELYESGKMPDKMKDALIRFLFSALCGGMRFCDVNNFARMIVKEDELTFIPIKTKRFEKMVNVPVPEYARELIRREHYRLMRPQHNSVINKLLKQIAYLADLDVALTFHIARYTFACIYLDATKDPMSLMDIMGISKYDTLRTYIRIYEDTTRTGVKKFNDFLFPTDVASGSGTRATGGSSWSRLHLPH
jgi:integrase/recombinase XerD